MIPNEIKITYISVNGSEIGPLILAFQELHEDLGEGIKLHPFSGESLSETEQIMQKALDSNLVIIRLHGGKKSLPGYDRLISSIRQSKALLHIQDSSCIDAELVNASTVGEDYRQIHQYISFGGRENLKNLLIFLVNRLGGTDIALGKPMMPPWDGIYHPAFDHVPSLEEYWQKRMHPERLTIGLWFNISMWQAQDLQVIDLIISQIEAHGANVIPVFLHTRNDSQLGSEGWEHAVRKYFMRDGKPVIDTLISTLMFSLTTGNALHKDRLIMDSLNTDDLNKNRSTENCVTGDRIANDGSIQDDTINRRVYQDSSTDECSMLQKLNVPVLKAILNYYSTIEEWSGSFQGLKAMDVIVNAAQPEFDGMLIGVPVGFRDPAGRDPRTGASIAHFVPNEERINKLVRLALNWARLKHIPPSERRIAIIFHNYPPRDDQIGTAIGLDSPQSVCRILHRMAEEGYSLDWLPADAQDLMKRLHSGATNERRFCSIQSIQKRAHACVSSEQYQSWFEELLPSVQEQMRASWGMPPGKLMTSDNLLIIPGIRNGNTFIGMQPPRGLLENPAEIYHSPDLPIPHHYYAYYRWIRDVFCANLVMHIGKHGTLEWLPGKSVGLSESCYPDIAISDLPNIYPYIINNPAEGIQAKRRSYCCLVDHLVPVMRNAGSYEEMAEIEVLSREYRLASVQDQKKLPELRKQIWNKILEANLDGDLDQKECPDARNFGEFLDKVCDHIFEISDSQVREGLHILGQPPSGTMKEEFLVSLTRLKNGRIPSLREALIRLQGFDSDQLLSDRAEMIFGQKTCAEILEEIYRKSLQIMEMLHRSNFSVHDIERVQIEVTGNKSQEVESVLRYVCEVLSPALEKTTNELDSILNAANGGYISPGPSGAPTRGMADILPTGRNFFSLDPRAIPSKAAWKVGIMQAESLLERYLQEEGRYPENIGIILWSTNTMRTGGDEVAEILYLMGVRPVWEDKSGRIDSLELISPGELKRPRIDVTVRISGIFRDSFPNVVELMDEAVQMVAGLKEAPEENYLAHHVETRARELIDSGVNEKNAHQKAGYRIFGSKPGTYGAGISAAIESKNWKDCNDLAEVYVLWGGYAYGRRSFGSVASEEFKRRLGSLDLTVKNEDTREIDMLDGDDFYSYHGGMIAAVKAIKGELPRSYCADSSDPDRIKTRSTAEETKHIFRARLLNPSWLESMKQHSYKGAADISRAVDIAFGWDATAEVLEDWMYEKLAEKYAFDEEMQKWLKEVNPHALQNIAERLLEAAERGMWQASSEMKQQLRDIYLEIEGRIEDE